MFLTDQMMSQYSRKRHGPLHGGDSRFAFIGRAASAGRALPTDPFAGR